MRTLFSLGIFFVSFHSLFASYVYFLDEDALDIKQRERLFNLIMRGEPPRCFYDALPLDLESECRRLAPSIRMEWIPSALWQIAVLQAFFQDEAMRHHILSCSRGGWDPIEYEEALHLHLPSASSIEEIAECFDRQSLALPGLCDLFFKANKAVASLYERSGGSDAEMLRLAIADLPRFYEWPQKQFPFWKSPWIFNPRSPQIFYSALQDEGLLAALLKIERCAHENGEWVLYRGYPGSGFPSTLQLDGVGSHALSFGSTLLGGAFFSLEATALTYSKPEMPTPLHSFLALRVTPQELKELFRVGPLHPFMQLLVNGEMFHAHTKIAASQADDYRTAILCGYFMESNLHCSDPIDYILTRKMTPEELERSFLSLCEKSGSIFNPP